jgi:endonuclease YncB( thermonuclease family)
MDAYTEELSMRALLLFALLVPTLATAAETSLSGVVRIVDGDTLAFGQQRVRLDGIDAPEKSQACYRQANQAGSAWACGQAAKEALTQMIGGQPVTCAASKTDRYGRYIAKCTVIYQGRTLDLGGAMVWNGWALAYTQNSKAYVGEQQQAQAAVRGIWGSHWQAPADYRRSQDGK